MEKSRDAAAKRDGLEREIEYCTSSVRIHLFGQPFGSMDSDQKEKRIKARGRRQRDKRQREEEKEGEGKGDETEKW